MEDSRGQDSEVIYGIDCCELRLDCDLAADNEPTQVIHHNDFSSHLNLERSLERRATVDVIRTPASGACVAHTFYSFKTLFIRSRMNLILFKYEHNMCSIQY